MRALLVLALLVATAARADPPPWRQAITEPDRKRLSLLWKAWETAKSQVVAAGHMAEWTALGDLVDPAARTEGGPPAPGSYRCRTVKLGTRNPGMPVWTMGEAVPCRFEMSGDYLRFVGGGRAQRSAGLLYPDGERLIFLGAVSLGSEPGRFAYARDAERDQVGVLHRIGTNRWRLELPWPKWESTLDIVEITSP